MKYADEFRDRVRAQGVTGAIRRTLDEIGATAARPVSIMEICGGHTHAIFRYGLDRLAGPGLEFIHGPGCPVCVLPMQRVDEAVEIAERPGVIFTTFGDAMRVPGTGKSLLQAKADGADIRMVYSPLDALALARRHPERQVVFFALGFETTTPSTALTVQQAAAEGIENFTLFCNHITVPPPLRVLLDDPGMRLDGFVGPGHVSMVIGVRPYDFIARDYGKPIVVAGFEPLDLLHAVLMVLRQIAEGRAEVERRFGIGYGATVRRVAEPDGCRCGDVMTGRIKPRACPKFGAACTPETPLGALMVSSEGACAAYYHYDAPALAGAA